ATRGVRFPSAGSDGETLQAEWEAVAPAGSRGAVAYDVYSSTDLTKGFVFERRVAEPKCLVPREEGVPAKFWVVLVAE
ncbi:MAG: hypothetical protein J6Y19_03905, partial [Kiritimatiellae bacterium]|nr:hypothetical protein [Kiritimatiellia bacterium]